MVPMKPGLYLGSIYLNYNDATMSQELPFGRIAALGVTVNVQGETAAGVYTYPFDSLVDGWRPGSVPYTWVDVKANATIDSGGLHSVTREDKTSGIGDIELTPVMAGWTNGDFQLNGMFNVWVPSGGYDKTQLANTGLGYWTFEPMMAVVGSATKSARK